MDMSDEKKDYTFQKVKETQKDLKDTDGFIWCADCHAVKHINSKTLKRTHYPPSEDEDD